MNAANLHGPRTTIELLFLYRTGYDGFCVGTGLDDVYYCYYSYYDYYCCTVTFTAPPPQDTVTLRTIHLIQTRFAVFERTKRMIQKREFGGPYVRQSIACVPKELGLVCAVRKR